MTSLHREPHKSPVIEVFSQVEVHRRIAEMIQRHSTNPEDIRAAALDMLALEDVREILELGCGFGSFAETLKGRIHPKAVLTGLDIIPAYEKPFLESCGRSVIACRFISSSVTRIETFADASYDLVLCSYALYFFPHVISQIARILKPTGAFVAITHDRKNMGELIEIIKGILSKNDLLTEAHLPVEKIMSRFCADNGQMLLQPWFDSIRIMDYRNALIFPPGDVAHILDYFRFKSPLFLTGTHYQTDKIISLLTWELKRSSLRRQGLTMFKDDRIFICEAPRRNRRKA